MSMNENKKVGANMLAYTTNWGQQTTFKLMPVNNECPFSEVIYDPSTTLLVVIGKTKKENFQNVPRLDNDGNPVRSKNKKQNGKPYQEERVLMDVLQEYYITEYEEQMEFLKRFSINFDTFNFKKFVRDMNSEPTPTLETVEKQGLVDEKGMSLKK